MSDYLGNILGRTFAPALVVKPRLPSFFEAPAAKSVTDDPVGTDSFGETLRTPFVPSFATARPPKPGETAASPVDPSPDSPPGSVITPVSPETRVPPGIKAATGSPAPLAEPAADSPRLPAPAPARNPGAPAKPAFPPAPPAPAGNPPLPAAVIETPRPRLHPVSVLKAPETAPADQDRIKRVPVLSAPAKVRPPTADREHEPVPGRITPYSAVIPRPAADPIKPTQENRPPVATTAVSNGIVVRPVLPVRETSHSPLAMPGRRELRQSAMPAREAPPPSISVHIGRVEVRASIPAASPRARSKKEPEMSLETYLQRRVEGGRR